MTTVHTLASGSSGNAAVLSCGDTHLLIDAGISCRRITVALKELGLTPADLTAILITHTHSDHISGLNTLLKKTICPRIVRQIIIPRLFPSVKRFGNRVTQNQTL